MSSATVSDRAPSIPGAPHAAGALIPSFPAWGLTWRTLVMGIGVALVVTAPWAGVWYYKWAVRQIALPNGARLRLDADVAGSWFLFVALGLVEWLGAGLRSELHSDNGYVLIFVLNAALGAMFVKWFCGSLRSADGSVQLSYIGGYWAYIGRSLLALLALFTIIGWAWVVKAMLQWVCRNVVGSPAVAFNGAGFEILWRTLVFALGSAFIVTIPFLMRWWTNWFVSRFAATSAQAPVPAA